MHAQGSPTWFVASKPSVGTARLWWLATRIALFALVGWCLIIAWALLTQPAEGVDRVLYMRATDRWLAGHGFYLPQQLAGPYAIDYRFATHPVYPPLLLYITVPMRFLPPVLWWAVPVAITVWSLIRLRPAPWTWPVLLALMLYPVSWLEFFWGGPSMWILAFASAGVAFGWPAVFVLLKPTLAPFALFGIRRRSWWIALGSLVVLSLPFGALWIDWFRAAVLNPTNSGGLLYSLEYVPTMCIPVVAWLGSTRPQGSPLFAGLGPRPLWRVSNP